QALFSGVENEETLAFKAKIEKETPEQTAEAGKLHDIFSFYNHGTQVASIVIEGNPAVRLLNARLTWPDNADVNDSTQSYEQWARLHVTNIRKFVAYFKKQKVRVVNASWSMTRNGVEENLEKDHPKMNARDRKILAERIFNSIKNALAESIGSAPEILFVVSAGNVNSDAGFNNAIPASLQLPNLITVGAVDAKGAAAMFTSFGKTVTLYALGVNIETVVPGGEKLKFGGTSAAAPQVTNLAAKLFAVNPNFTVKQVVQFIKQGAETSDNDKRLKLINPKRSVQLINEEQD
ncbi:MAG TPA: S8 family serine peptidase, partial [Flavisolibacter sp.]|nr:S8 family serine peptidase [Flavisolibacter sp.]